MARPQCSAAAAPQGAHSWGGCRGWGWGLCGDRRWPWWLCAPWGRAQWVCMAGEEKAELTGRDNGSERNNCLGESPRSIRETDFYMHVFKGISFAFLFPSPFFCFGIKGQKGALLTIKFNLNRKEGRTGTWLTRELAAGGGEHPPVPPSSVPPPPPSMGRSRGQHTALLPFPSSSLPLCCDLSIRGRSRLCVVPRVPTCP